MGAVDQQRLIDFLNAGGAVYMEGADVGYSHNNTEFFSYFGADFTANGGQNIIQSIQGVEGIFTAPNGFTYPYGTDADYSIDELDADEGILCLESQQGLGRAVLNNNGFCRTIISSPILGALKDESGSSTKSSLMTRYLNFLQGKDEADIWLDYYLITFPDQYIGFTGSMFLTMENHGLEDLMVNDVSVTGNGFGIDIETPFLMISGEQILLEVTFTATEAGVFTGLLLIDSEDPDENLLEIPLAAECLQPPVCEVSLDQIEITLEPDNQGETNLVLSNAGNSPLHFQISLEEVGSRSVYDPVPILYPNTALAKDEFDYRQGYPVNRDQGGPDNFGYQWIDSNEPGGPDYEWFDISTIGTNSGLSGDDSSVLLTLPFEFSFYGETKTSVMASTNGYLTFGSDGNVYFNTEIPSSESPNDLICPFWDDLSQLTGSHYYYYDQAQHRYIIQYHNWGFFGGAGGLYFQVQLYENGAIRFIYNSMSGGTPTIGIENAAGDDGLQICFNSNYVQNEMAVLLTCGPVWLDAEPLSGTIPAGGSQNIIFSFDATGLDFGIYEAVALLQTNDPANPEIILPITLNVDYVGTNEDELPLTTRLEGNYPNPFNPSTRIDFSLQTANFTNITMYNCKGQLVRTLLAEQVPAGHYSVVWDGRDEQGRQVVSGIYFCRLTSGNQEVAKKMILLK